MILDFFDAVLVNLGRREGGDSAVNVRPEKRFELRLRFRAELIQRDRMVPEPFPVNFAEDGAEKSSKIKVILIANLFADTIVNICQHRSISDHFIM